MRLGMGVTMSVVGLLLLLHRMRREHARLVGLLLRALLLVVVLVRSVRRRGTRPNAGQESLEIVWRGHFCRAPRREATTARNPSSASSQELSFERRRGSRAEASRTNV